MTILEVEIIKLFIEKLDKIKETDEDCTFIRDLKFIDNTIEGLIEYNRDEINNIKKRYEDEINFLINLEISLRPNQVINSSKSNNPYQPLLNLRHVLLRVGALRMLKRKGKRIADEDLINNDNNYLLNLFIKINN